jgi:hypothetical protein
VSETFRSVSSIAPGWTSTGSVDEPSEGAFRVDEVVLGERRGVFRFDASGLLRGAMNAVDASRDDCFPPF